MIRNVNTSFIIFKAIQHVKLTFVVLNLFEENWNILHFLSFLSVEMAWLVEILSHGRPRPLYPMIINTITTHNLVPQGAKALKYYGQFQFIICSMHLQYHWSTMGSISSQSVLCISNITEVLWAVSVHSLFYAFLISLKYYGQYHYIVCFMHLQYHWSTVGSISS